jgi:hypothetical protein
MAWLLVVAALVASSHAVEPWRTAEQPDLKQALKKAPLLQTESLG